MKKAIAIIIAAVMLCVVLTTDSADADLTYLYVNGHAVTGDETNNEEGWSFAVTGRTLTLNNANLDVIYSDDMTHLDTTIVYLLTSTLNIVLIGDSTVSVADGPGWYSTGIFSYGSVAISGDGSLTIVNHRVGGEGVYASDGDITINGGDITIDAGVGIYCDNTYGDFDKGNINITGGTIHMNGRISGGYYSCLDMTGGYLSVSGLAADGVVASFEDSINLHSAVTINATATVQQITATAAGDVIISHLYDKTITFNPNGGTCSPDSRQTNIEGKVLMPSPHKLGYVFTGWFTSPFGGDQKTNDSRFSEDTILYVHWAPSICSVSLEVDGGSCDVDYIEVHYGETATLPVAIREGYAFIGWFTSPSGGDQMTNDSHFYDDTILYAHWVRVYTVTFDANSGQCLFTSAVTGSDGKLDSLPTATREGYNFLGWFTSPSGGEQVGPDNVYDLDTTIYANWTSNSDPSSDSGDDKKGNNGLIIGGIIGGIAAVAVIAGVVIFFIRKH